MLTGADRDYPDFYKQLYALLDTSIFYVKHRVTFFPLLDQFLSSTWVKACVCRPCFLACMPLILLARRHLPAYLAAAFAKRLMRLALQAPPSGVEVTVQLVYNLIKRHSSLKRLAHRRLTGQSLSRTAGGLEIPCYALEFTSIHAPPPFTPVGIDEGETPTMAGDPYDIEQEDPAQSNAMVRLVKGGCSWPNSALAGMSLPCKERLTKGDKG